MKIKYKDVIQANKQDEAEKERKKEKTQKPEKSQPECPCVVAHPAHHPSQFIGYCTKKMTNMSCLCEGRQGRWKSKIKINSFIAGC